MHELARTTVVGAGGYTGLEAVRWLSAHPSVQVVALGSDRLAGRQAHDVLAGAPRSLPAFVPNQDAVATEADIALLCTPHEVAARLCPGLLARGIRVIDLSGAHRLRVPALYPRWYGFEHPTPELLGEARWSLPEVTGALPEETRLVANPGCYVTAIVLALEPLVRGGLMMRDGIVADAKSGASGAGRTESAPLLLSELEGNLYAYKVGRHQHTPEIEQALDVPVTLVTQLLPVRRGILATCHGRASGAEVDTRAVLAAVRGRYGDEPFVDVYDNPGRVSLRAVVGTNRVALSATVDPERRTVTAFAAIDNLVKGAAGQAIQNLNLLLGLPHHTGLQATAPGA